MSTAIGVSQIGTCRYAPEGANAVNTYTFNGLEDMPIGKLIMAICVQRAALDESMSVITMNRMTTTAAEMAAAADVLEQVMDESTTWDTLIDISRSGYEPRKVPKSTTLKNFLEIEIGVTELPDTLDSIDDRLKASEKITPKIDELNRAAEEDSVKLQSQLSRRDVEYRTAASTVYSLGQAGMIVADSLL